MSTTHAEHEQKLKEREAHVVNVSKATTKVNLVTVIAILLFFIACGIAAGYMWNHRAQTTDSMQEKEAVPH